MFASCDNWYIYNGDGSWNVFLELRMCFELQIKKKTLVFSKTFAPMLRKLICKNTTASQVCKRETVDYIMKPCKHFVHFSTSVCGGVGFLLNCQGDHPPILQGSYLPTSNMESATNINEKK